MKCTLLALGLTLSAVGCASPTETARQQWPFPLSPEEVQAWSPEEAKAVLTAWTRLRWEAEQRRERPTDFMNFRVERIPEGWRVSFSFVDFLILRTPVARQDELTVVVLDQSWQVTRIRVEHVKAGTK
jgi:hypothetical protein